jgi:hypothetical protein
LSFPPVRATICHVPAERVVTAVQPANTIEYVPSRMLLTKRRAVDFCRVATAMCPRSVPLVA